MRETQDSARTTSCANNLEQLWIMQPNYMMRFGGSNRLMPLETGDAFWLKLSDPNVRLIDDTVREIHPCPVEKVDDGPGTCDYRGPSGNVNDSSLFGDGDPVGADVDGNHGEGRGGNGIRKAGDVQTCSATDLLWTLAATKTKGGNPATPKAATPEKLSVKQQQALVHWGHLAIACFLCRRFHGDLPKSLQDLVERPKDEKSWPEGGYLLGGKLPKDPRGNDYMLETEEGSEPSIWTWGADGREGGEGENADLSVQDVFREPEDGNGVGPSAAGGRLRRESAHRCRSCA